MYKLSGHSLTKGTWFIPETQPMILQERDSTCSITLWPDAPAIAFDDWLLDDEWPDGPYVWRVKGINDDTGADTKTVELEHVIKILDDLTLGEVTVEDIAGSGATTCSAQAAAAYILSKTSDWTLGDFEYGTSNPYEFNGETLYDALETVTDTLDNAVWEYDLSVYPFKVHIRQRDNTVRCEMRGERNLSSLKRSVSRSGMYTRIYPTGKNDLHIDGDYLSKNEGLYGRVDHRETDQSKSTKENLQAWAQGRLNRHCEPTVSITITGLELSQETGETLDNLKLNKICQVPLPEYATTITERIVKKQWRDRRKEPENVTLTLANNVRDISSIVKEQTRGGSGGRAGAGQAKQNYLFEANGEHLLYEVFDECGHVHGLLRMTSESLRIAFENLNDSTRSEFLLTAESLRIQFENEISSTRSEFQMTSESLRIQFENEISSTRSEFEMTSESLRIQFENDVSSLRSDLQMTAESLRVSFTNEASSLRSEMQMSAASLRLEFQNADSSLRSEMQLTAESLRISFNNEASSLRSEFQLTAGSLRVEFQNADSSLRSAINAEAGRISLIVDGYGSSAEVKRAAIILAINNGASSAHIDADEVYIGNDKSSTVIAGKTTLAEVESEKLNATYLNSLIGNIPILSVRSLSIQSGGSINSAGYIYAPNFVIGSNSSGGGGNVYLSNAVIGVDVTGNVLTLTQANGNETSFSKATSLSGAWSGSTLTVTASPQDEHYYQAITSGTWENEDGSAYTSGNRFYIPIKAYNPNSSPPTYTQVNRVLVDASSIYTAGYNDGKPNGTITIGSKVTGTVWNVSISRSDGTALGTTKDFSDIYTDARSGYYTQAEYDANWTTGFNAGVPTGATLGTKVTGTTWNVSIARGSYTAVGKTIDLANAYTDARSGYYTKAQYDANWTTGFNAGVPTGATLGTKVTGTTWNVSIARGSYTAVGKTIDLSSAYTDARSGYYTKAQYDANYNSGWNDCRNACTEVTRYTRSATGGGGAYGGNNYAHYISYQGSYKNVGTGWYQTTQANAYTRPAAK